MSNKKKKKVKVNEDGVEEPESVEAMSVDGENENSVTEPESVDAQSVEEGSYEDGSSVGEGDV